MWDGILAGAGVATITGGTALVALHWAYDKGNQTFFVVFLGGMTLRLIFVVALSALVISFTEVHRNSFIVSLLVVYLLFLGLEIYYALIKNAANADAESREKGQKSKSQGYYH